METIAESTNRYICDTENSTERWVLPFYFILSRDQNIKHETQKQCTLSTLNQMRVIIKYSFFMVTEKMCFIGCFTNVLCTNIYKSFHTRVPQMLQFLRHTLCNKTHVWRRIKSV